MLIALLAALLGLTLAAAQRGETKPQLMLATGLPIIWGEQGFSLSAQPAPAYRALEREFAVRPLDTLHEEELAGGKLLLLAQPKVLAPAELVALDAWVRRGGRALILTDPALVWPSELPLGDIRRPPPFGLLEPLLRHWGLRLEPSTDGIQEVTIDGGTLRLETPGQFQLEQPGCALHHDALVADCPIGGGRALLVADADLVHERLWMSSDGRRTADNPSVVAAWLDDLVGLQRQRADSGRGDTRTTLLALIPILVVAAAASLVWRRRRG